MRFLIFMDGLRVDLIWMSWVLLFGMAVYLLWAPKVARPWRKTMMRVMGLGFLGIFICASLVLLGAMSLAAGDPPREHVGFISPSGARDALLSHSSYRDGAASQVSIKLGCCRRAIVYDYSGDGDDSMGASSVRWLDDRHLAIRYAEDSSQVQVCRTEAGDLRIACEPHPSPIFDDKGGR